MLNEEQKDLLLAGANQLRVALSTEAVEQFARFIEEIQRWSKIADLLSQIDTGTLIRKHILDSFALLSLISQESRVLDLGSGAGFPGIPLAIAGNLLSITLVESRRKRANFLKEVTRKLGLRNVQVYERRVEQVSQSKEMQGAFDIVTTRSTWNISQFLYFSTPFLKEVGIAMAMKGPKLPEELTKLKKTGETRFSHSYTKEYTLPGGERRAVAVFTKLPGETSS